MTDVEVEASGHVVTIRLNRPARRNAVTTAMYAQLADEFGKADAAAEARSVRSGA